MTETGNEDTSIAIANGVLQAIAMGTFIYVTFFEILQEEIDPDDSSLTKIFFVAAGFSLMALLGLIPEQQLQQQTAAAAVAAGLIGGLTYNNDSMMTSANLDVTPAGS